MASKGYSVGLAVDGSAARKGIETGLIDPVENAQEALIELGKSKGPEQLEKDLDAAAQATKDLKKETKATADAIADEFRRSYAQMKDAQRDANRSAEAGMEELKDESRSTAKEAAASFDGSAESIVDMFQEVAANAFAGFGPAGVIAGIAVASGIGVATQAFSDNQAASEEATQRVREYGLQIIEAGRDSAALEYVSDNLKAIVSNSDDAAKKLKDIQTLTKKFPALAGDTAALAKAYAGNSDAIDYMIEKTEELAAAQVTGKERSAGVTEAHKRNRDELQGVADELRRVQEETKTAQAIEEEWLAAGGQEYLNRTALIDQMNTAYDEAAGAVEDYIDKETGVFNLDAYIAAMNGKLAALGEYQTLLASSSLSTSAKTYLGTLGEEAAATLMQNYKTGTDAQKASLDKIWSEAGKSNSGQYQQTFKAGIPDRIDKTPKLDVDTSTGQKSVDNFVERNTGKTLKLTIVGVDRNGKVVI